MPPRIGILSSQRGFHVRQLEEAILGRGCEPAYFPITRLAGLIRSEAAVRAGDERLEDCSHLLVRTIPAGSLEQTVFRMDVLHRLEHIGIRVVNSASAIERTVDKYYTSFLLADAGIPTPRTLATGDLDAAMQACRDFGDVVIKPLFGSEGKGMVRVSDEETAYRVLRAWDLNRYVFYIQEYIPHFNEDIRAFVVGGEVAAAMRRRAAGWKTNFSKGASVEPIQLDADLNRLALRAAEIVGLDYAGVDILPAENGTHYVLEINSIPGWRGLQKTTEVRIAQRIIDHLLGAEMPRTAMAGRQESA